MCLVPELPEHEAVMIVTPKTFGGQRFPRSTTYTVLSTEEELNALCKCIEDRLDSPKDLPDSEMNLLANIHQSIMKGFR